MKHFGLLLLLIPALAFGQAVRVDQSLLMPGPNVPVSGSPLPQALLLANSQVQICAHPATINSCTPIQTYGNSAETIVCPLTSQLTAPGGSTCQSTVGITADVGFWYAGGTVDYLVYNSTYGTLGPYSVSAGSGGGTYTGSSPIVVTGTVISCPTCGTSLATVQSFGTGAWLSWLTPSVTNPTTTPVLALAAATGQTSHQVIGTCGTATTFTPCALQPGDIPTLNQNTTGTAANLSGTPTLPSGTVLPGYVPTSTTVNGHALSSNVVVSASDLTTGTLPHAQLPTLLSGDIPNNAANTSGTAAGLASGGTIAGLSNGCLNITSNVVGSTGSACGSGGGSGTVSGQTAGYIPVASAATALTGPSPLDVGITTAGVVTSADPMAVNCPTCPNYADWTMNSNSLPSWASGHSGFSIDTTANSGVVGYYENGTFKGGFTALFAAKVPTSTTVNGHALSSNVVVSASDLTTGTLPHGQLPTLLSGDIPNNAANTTGSAASLSISGQTGLLTFTGLTSTNRAKTVRDAADTILELGGSYTPTGTWTNLILVTPALGTPSAINLTNATALPGTLGCVPSSFATQADGSTVTWAIASAMCANASLTFTVHSGSRTLNLTGLVTGGSYVIKLIQDSTGGENLTGGTGCTWKQAGGGGSTFTLTATAAALDVLAFMYDGTNCLATLTKAFS